MNKINIIAANNLQSKKIKSFLEKNLKKISIKKIKLSIVIGGDGFMLNTLKKNIKSNNFFYGINSGNYGFLMNRFNYFKTIKNLATAKKITIFPLEMIVRNKDNKIKKSLSINEVSVLRQSRQGANLLIKNNSVILIRKLVSDGVLVSTPAGSTAYNLSVHGPILKLNSNKISVAPISPFRPRRWKGKILSDTSKVFIKNLDIKKRPISAVADNFEVRNAKTIIIKTNKKIKINLLYDKNNSLEKKIKLEQIRKEIN